MRREYWRGLGDEKLLRRYERARKADVAAMGAVTDGLHSLFAQTDVRWQALAQLGHDGFCEKRAAQAMGDAAGDGSGLDSRREDTHETC